jgi:hypothetical protein
MRQRLVHNAILLRQAQKSGECAPLEALDPSIQIFPTSYLVRNSKHDERSTEREALGTACGELTATSKVINNIGGTPRQKPRLGDTFFCSSIRLQINHSAKRATSCQQQPRTNANAKVSEFLTLPKL